jgi:hypothetical protein
MLSALISLLTGCAPKPAPPPDKPGTSLPLAYPVLLAGDRRLDVRDDENALLTTNVAMGINFLDVKIIASDEMMYKVEKVTQFGRKAFLLDMVGMSHFQVFLQLKQLKKPDLKQAKALVLEVAMSPNGMLTGWPRGVQVATERVQACASIAALIEACRKAWEWH